MSKAVMILFSGGWDSTYLVWRNLKEGNIVKPVYFEITNNVDKVIVEQQQISRICDKFAKEFGIRINTNTITSFGLKLWDNNVTFTQPLIWTLSMAFAIEHNIDEIQVGYVQGDDAILYLKEIKKLYNATKPFTKNHPKLTFPLIKEKLSKYEIIDELPRQYHSLITSCETPELSKFGFRTLSRTYREFKPCCDCIPCKKIISHDYFRSDEIRRIYNDPLYHKNKKQVIEYESRKFGWQQAIPAFDPIKESTDVDKYEQIEQKYEQTEY